MTKAKTIELGKQNISIKRLTFHHDFEIPLICWNLEDFLDFLFCVVVRAWRDPQLVRTYKNVEHYKSDKQVQ